VQGETAAPEIATAIRDFNEFGEADVLIVGRGGGSFEDLWAFNEEIVARAIFGSQIPVISAVGHEIDYSISDFVADQRAPTPSAAAEMVVRDSRELMAAIAVYSERISGMLLQRITAYQERIQNMMRSYAFRRPEDIVFQKMQRLDELARNIQTSLQHSITVKLQALQNRQNQLKALSPLEVLQRGYSICFKDGIVIKDIKQLSALDMVQVRLAHGQFISQVQMLGESK